MRACVIYYTKTGHTRDAAHYVAEGLRREGWTADVLSVGELDVASLRTYDAVMFGSPCRAGSLRLPEGVAGPAKGLLRRLPADGLRGKAVGAFSVHNRFGGDRTVSSIERRLAALGGNVVAPGLAVRGGAPLSLWRGPDIGPKDAERLRELGAAVARGGNAEGA